MYIKFEYGQLYFSDTFIEGYKRAIQSTPPAVEENEAPVYYWMLDGDHYVQLWEIRQIENIIEDSEALNILLGGEE